MAYGLSNGHVTDDVTWPWKVWKVKLVTPIRLECNISKTTWAIETSNLVCSFVSGMPSGCTKNLSESWRGLGHVTPIIFGIRSNISLKLLDLETSNLVCSFLSGMPSGRTNNFPESGRGLGHVTPTIFGIRSNISLKLLDLENSHLIHGFVWARRTNKFPWKWAWPTSRDPYNFWQYGLLS